MRLTRRAIFGLLSVDHEETNAETLHGNRESTMTSIREKLELGTHYARNNQWSNAAGGFAKAIEQIYQNATGGLSPEHLPGSGRELKKALQDLKDKPVAIDKAPDVLKQLHGAHQRAHGLQGLADDLYVSAFQNLSADGWTLVYHGQKKLRYHDELSQFSWMTPLPAGPSFSFALTITGDEIKSVALSHTTTVQLTYALSHLAQAKVNEVIGVYRQYQILAKSGTTAIQEAARYYSMALLINPDNAWAISHLGDVFRVIANGWPGNDESIANQHISSIDRIFHYLWAIICFEEDIRLRPNSFWAYAHVGAAIVNVRAFIGHSESEDPGTGADIGSHMAIDKSISSLIKAQQLAGNHYPWAQLYYGGALLIKAALSENPEHVHNLATLSTLMAIDGYRLEPSLLAGGFEPNQLYVSPFFQFGLIYLHVKRYSQAWEYICIGMERIFEFHFLPGLQTLLGYQLLVNISAECIDPESTSTWEAVSDQHDFSLGVIPIPKKPIKNRDQLFEFVENILKKSCEPTVNPFLGEDIKLNTNIEMGLVQAYFVLGDFCKILGSKVFESIGSQDSVTSLKGKIEECSVRIRSKLEKDTGLPLPEKLNNYNHSLNDTFTFMNTGKISGHQATLLLL